MTAAPAAVPLPALPPIPERIALIFGGVSPEHEVSILSASQVTGAISDLAGRVPLHVQTIYINKEGQWVWRANGGVALNEEQILAGPKWDCQPSEHAVEIFSFSRGLEQLRERRIDAALLILHGQNVEDGRLQGALDLAGVPYSGSGAQASTICFNKTICQAVLNAARLPIAPSVAIHQHHEFNIDQIVNTVGLPLVIKPAQGGSSVGMSIVYEAEEMPAALERGFEIDAVLLAEKFVSGQEFTAGVIDRLHADGTLKPLALPIIQIVPPEGHFYDYESKYFDDRTQYLIQAPVSLSLVELMHGPQLTGSTAGNEEITQALQAAGGAIDLHKRLPIFRRMQELALRAYRACGCYGYARVDFICDIEASREPIILEINTLPGMTSHSLLPKAAAAAGIDYPTLIGFMLASARHD